MGKVEGSKREGGMEIEGYKPYNRIKEMRGKIRERVREGLDGAVLGMSCKPVLCRPIIY